MVKSKNPLMTALRFGPKDLEANRAGLLTQRQKQNVWRQHSTWFGIGWGVVVFLLCGGISLYLIFNFGENNVSHLLLLIPAFLLGMFLFYSQQKLRALLKQGKVDMIIGIAKIAYRPRGRLLTPYLRVDQKDFSLSQEVADAFIKEKKYIFYFLPQTQFLLSAEYYEETLKLPLNK